MQAIDVVEFCTGIIGSGWYKREDLLARVMEEYTSYKSPKAMTPVTDEQLKRDLTIIVESYRLYDEDYVPENINDIIVLKKIEASSL